MKKFVALVSLAWVSLPATAAAAYTPRFTPMSLVDINVSVSCSLLPNRHEVSFSFRIQSATDSKQNLGTLLLAYESPVDSSIPPAGWTSDDMTHGYWAFTVDFNGQLVPPGGYLDGAAFVSQGLPAVEPFRAKGDAPDPPPPPPDLTQEEYDAYMSAADYFNNSAKGYTVGPGPVTTSSPVASIVSFLAAQKEKAAGLGWIDNGGVVNSLDVKLDAAQRALSRGDTKAARGELAAFENEVKAQSGKHLDGNAVAILQTGAEVALNDLQ